MKRLLAACCLLVALALGRGAFAATPGAADLIAQAHAKGLASDQQWLRLLHYKPARGGDRSDVISPSFFLSPDGAWNPQAELDATLTALVTAGADETQDAQCRFPRAPGLAQGAAGLAARRADLRLPGL